MTLVDSSALAAWRNKGEWGHVRSNLSHVKPFPFAPVAPHELPGRFRDAGIPVAVVTAAVRWYAESIINSFGIKTDVLVTYEDTAAHKPDAEPINAALQKLGVDPETTFHVGDAPTDVEASYHAGVRSIGAGWGVQNFDAFSSSAPDLLFFKPSSMLKFSEFDRRGYLAETIARHIGPKAHLGSILPCGGEYVRYALGRYFTRSDPRHAGDPLSDLLLTYKNEDAPAPLFADALVRAIEKMDWEPGYVVSVPPKPSQTRNRFTAAFNVAKSLSKGDTEFLDDGLICVKEIENYKSMGLYDRLAAISGAFRSKYSWNGAKVLLVDDVLTTGGTVGECARQLLANGASEVRILTFGRDQQVFAKKICPACGRTMRIRADKHGEQFWGCSGFPNACKKTERL